MIATDPSDLATTMPRATAKTASTRAPLLGVKFALIALFSFGGGSSAAFAEATDPFALRALTAESPSGKFDSTSTITPCGFDAAEAAPLSLADVVNRALCRNPQTRAAWSNARVQAAQVGIARAAYLPALNAVATANRNRSEVGASATNVYNQGSAGVTAGYLLYDFGARDAALESAMQTLMAANFSHDAALQKVFLAAVQAYYQLFATRAAVDSARQAERTALQALRAAAARYDAGSGTPADKLQAQTAHSQAVLNRIQAEGTASSAEGALASAMGLDANRSLNYSAPQPAAADASFDKNLEQLIAAARARRPDLAAAEAQVQAARANVQTAKAQGMPTISLSTNLNYANSGSSDLSRSAAIGVTVSIPIFLGFNTLYRVRTAEAQIEAQAAQRDAIHLQVALDVWQAYYSLVSGTQALRASADLLASATASERVALGRYKAGAGNIIDLLTAQAALASARLQNIQAQYNWYLFKAALAQAIGQIDFSALRESEARP